MPAAGIFKEAIEVYNYEKESNDYGEMIEVRHRKYECRAAVSHIGGQRQVWNNEIAYPYQRTFIMRYHIPITEDDEIKWNDRFWKVTSINRDRELYETVVIAEQVNE